MPNSNQQSQAPPDPPPLSVPTSQYFEGNDGSWSTFALQIGKPVQNVRVLPSTAAYSTWLIDAANACPGFLGDGCENSRGGLYNNNRSLTWVPESKYDLGIEKNLDLDSTADYGFDTVALGYPGSGTAASQDHQVIVDLADPHYWLGNIGLNPRPTNFSDLNNPQDSFISSLKNHNQIPSLSYSYTAGATYRFSRAFGSLTFGGQDTSLTTPANPGISLPFSEDVSRDLVISIQKITSSGASPSALLPQPIYAYVDSTVPFIYLPQAACTAFEHAFNLTWDTQAELYLLTDSAHSALKAQNPNVTFTLAAQSNAGPTTDITLPYSAFDLTASYPLVQVNTTSPYFPLKRAASEGQYTLGRTFLQEAVLTADYDRSNFTIAPRQWSQNLPANIQPIRSPDLLAQQKAFAASSSSNKNLSGGAIAGIVVGIVAFLALLAALLFFLLRRRRSNRRAADEEKARALAHQHADGPSPYSTDTNPYFKAQAEADSASRFELNQDHGGGKMHGFDVAGKSELASPDGGVARSELHGRDRAAEMGDSAFARSELDGGGGKWWQKGRRGPATDGPVFEMPGDEGPRRPRHPAEKGKG